MDEIATEARIIASRNVSQNVARVVVRFDARDGRLSVIYCTLSAPTDADEDDCELSCGEIIAALPQVRVARTECVAVDQYTSQLGDLVVYEAT